MSKLADSSESKDICERSVPKNVSTVLLRNLPKNEKPVKSRTLFKPEGVQKMPENKRLFRNVQQYLKRSQKQFHERMSVGFRKGGGGGLSYTNRISLGRFDTEPPRDTTMASAGPAHVYALLDFSLAAFSKLARTRDVCFSSTQRSPLFDTLVLLETGST